MNIMSLQHFNDFYYLEAIRAGLSMAVSSNPELQFRHAFVRLETDVNEAFETLTRRMADRIAAYIWAAGIGEARHAGDFCELALDDIEGQNRSFVYRHSLDYPIADNLETLESIFAQEWSNCGYGGEKWFECVEALDLYGKVSNATFIDHTVDLEHNGGNIFTKDAADYVYLECFEEGDYYHQYNSDKMTRFLNFKFSNDILQDLDFNVNVTAKTYNLLVRFGNIITPVKSLDRISAKLEWLDEADYKWGNKTLEVIEGDGGKIECSYCNRKFDADDTTYYNDEYWCDDCFNRHFTHCDKCEEYYTNDETIETPEHPKYYHLCNDCAYDEGYHNCDSCGDWKFDCIETEDNYHICGDCKDEHLCGECGEYHYDLIWHNKTEHPVYVPAVLPVDSDGIFEIVDDYPESSPWELKEIVTNFHNGQKTITICTNGYVYKGYNYLVILDVNSFDTKTGEKLDNTKADWSVTSTLSGMSMFHSKTYNSLHMAKKLLETAYNSGIDWSKIWSNTDFEMLPYELRYGFIKAAKELEAK